MKLADVRGGDTPPRPVQDAVALPTAAGEALCALGDGVAVHYRLRGENDVAKRLDAGAAVTLVARRSSWAQVLYMRGTRPAAGWVRGSDLGECSDARSDSQESAGSAGLDRLHPFGRPIGTVDGGRLLEGKAYDCYYDPGLKFCRWVAYCAGSGDAHPPRHKGFIADPRVRPGERAELDDYDGLFRSDRSGFDKGHLAPDGTIKGFGTEAQKETYYLSNITPQYTKLNQGLWRQLEDAIREWASPQEEVCVVTGPTFERAKAIVRVGPNRVAVPHGYFAVVMRGDPPEVLGVTVTNEPAARKLLEAAPDVLVSVDDIESRTELNFMSALPDALEAQIEADVAIALWER